MVFENIYYIFLAGFEFWTWLHL